MDIQTLEIVQTANRLVDTLGTRDPHRIARELGIEVVPVDFKRQRGAYKVLMRNRFIFIKNDLHPVMECIVMLHEIGHDVLHRKEAVKAGGFKEFNIFNMQESRMEYEANVFASDSSISICLRWMASLSTRRTIPLSDCCSVRARTTLLPSTH